MKNSVYDLEILSHSFQIHRVKIPLAIPRTIPGHSTRKPSYNTSGMALPIAPTSHSFTLQKRTQVQGLWLSPLVLMQLFASQDSTVDASCLFHHLPPLSSLPPTPWFSVFSNANVKDIHSKLNKIELGTKEVRTGGSKCDKIAMW